MTTVSNKDESYYILSIDPGFRNLAYSIFKVVKNNDSQASSFVYFVECGLADFKTDGITWSNSVGTQYTTLVKNIHEWFIKQFSTRDFKYIILEVQNNKKMVIICTVLLMSAMEVLKQSKGDVVIVFPKSVGQFYKLNGNGREQKKKDTQTLINKRFNYASYCYGESYDLYDSALNLIYFLERIKDFQNTTINFCPFIQ